MSEQTAEQKNIQDEVNGICNELFAQGNKVSVRMVLSMLPNINSTSTVHKYYKVWHTEKEASSQTLYEKLGFSEKFTKHFMEEVTRFSIEAEQRYKQQAVDANDQRDKAIEDLERAEDRLYKQSSLLEQTQKELKTANASLADQESKSKAEINRLKLQLEEVARQQEEELAHHQESIQAEENVSDTLRTELAKAQLKCESFDERIAGYKENITTLATEKAQLAKEKEELSITVAEQNVKATADKELVVELKAGISRLAGTSEDNKVLLIQVNELERINREYVAKVEDLEGVAVVNLDNLKQKNSIIDTLQQSLAAQNKSD